MTHTPPDAHPRPCCADLLCRGDLRRPCHGEHRRPFCDDLRILCRGDHHRPCHGEHRLLCQGDLPLLCRGDHNRLCCNDRHHRCCADLRLLSRSDHHRSCCDDLRPFLGCGEVHRRLQPLPNRANTSGTFVLQAKGSETWTSESDISLSSTKTERILYRDNCIGIFVLPPTDIGIPPLFFSCLMYRYIILELPNSTYAL